MDSITIGGLDENEFRRSIQTMLRKGKADDAASTLRELLAPYTGPAKLLPERFMSVTPRDVSIAGWSELNARIGKYDRPDHRISALRIALTEPDPDTPAPQPDASGKLSPLVETSYYTDVSFPFSEADRNDLLDGYSMDDSAWQGDFEAADTAVKVQGIEDLYGSVAAIEARVMESAAPDDDEIRAGSLGACYLAVLIHQAVRDTVHRHGLPRTLCVLAGQDNVYPFFDAPVVACDEYPDDGASTMATLPHATASAVVLDPESDENADSPYDYGRLSGMTPRKARKTPVIMLDAAEANLAAHQVEIEAERLLADADRADDEHAERPALLAVHEHAVDGIGLTAADTARPFEAPEAAATVRAEAAEPHEAVEPAEIPPLPAPLFASQDADQAIHVAVATPDQDSEPEPIVHAARIEPVAAVANVVEIPAMPEPAFDPMPSVEWQTWEAAPEPVAPSSVRALRARIAAEPVPEPTFGERIAAAWQRLLARLGLG